MISMCAHFNWLLLPPPFFLGDDDDDDDVTRNETSGSESPHVGPCGVYIHDP